MAIVDEYTPMVFTDPQSIRGVTSDNKLDFELGWTTISQALGPMKRARNPIFEGLPALRATDHTQKERMPLASY